MINWLFVGIGISIILIGFFTGIEIAFVSLNRLNVELKKKQGKNSGTLFAQFLEDPSRFIGTTLTGSIVWLVIFILLSGSVWTYITNWAVKHLEVEEAYLIPLRLIIEAVLSVIVVIVLGEFIPRAIWRAKNEWLLSRFISGIISYAYQFFYPIASFFVAIAEWVLKYLFNVRIDERKGSFRRADLEHFLQQGDHSDEEGKDLNTELFENALSLPNVKVRQCLIPRKEIIGIEMKAGMAEVRRKFAATKLSKLVVYEHNIDHVVGYVHQLDLFKQPTTLESILLPIPAVPESMSATDLISKFSKERKSIAWVVDEFGGTAGIVTMEDLLEEIFGEIKDEYDTEDLEEKKLSDDEYMFSGRLELDYLNEKYHFEFPADDAETLSGFIIDQYEKIPRVKERIIAGDYEFEIISVSDTRIEMVKMKVLK